MPHPALEVAHPAQHNQTPPPSTIKLPLPALELGARVGSSPSTEYVLGGGPSPFRGEGCSGVKKGQGGSGYDVTTLRFAVPAIKAVPSECSFSRETRREEMILAGQPLSPSMCSTELQPGPATLYTSLSLSLSLTEATTPSLLLQLHRGGCTGSALESTDDQVSWVCTTLTQSLCGTWEGGGGCLVCLAYLVRLVTALCDPLCNQLLYSFTDGAYSA